MVGCQESKEMKWWIGMEKDYFPGCISKLRNMFLKYKTSPDQ